jgi:hypothetical protein
LFDLDGYISSSQTLLGVDGVHASLYSCLLSHLCQGIFYGTSSGQVNC